MCDLKQNRYPLHQAFCFLPWKGKAAKKKGTHTQKNPDSLVRAGIQCPPRGILLPKPGIAECRASLSRGSGGWAWRSIPGYSGAWSTAASSEWGGGKGGSGQETGGLSPPETRELAQTPAWQPLANASEAPGSCAGSPHRMKESVDGVGSPSPPRDQEAKSSHPLPVSQQPTVPSAKGGLGNKMRRAGNVAPSYALPWLCAPSEIPSPYEGSAFTCGKGDRYWNPWGPALWRSKLSCHL